MQRYRFLKTCSWQQYEIFKAEFCRLFSLFFCRGCWWWCILGAHCFLCTSVCAIVASSAFNYYRQQIQFNFCLFDVLMRIGGINNRRGHLSLSLLAAPSKCARHREKEHNNNKIILFECSVRGRRARHCREKNVSLSLCASVIKIESKKMCD